MVADTYGVKATEERPTTSLISGGMMNNLLLMRRLDEVFEEFEDSISE